MLTPLLPLLFDNGQANPPTHTAQALNSPRIASTGNGDWLQQICNNRAAQQTTEPDCGESDTPASMEPEVDSMLECATVIQSLCPPWEPPDETAVPDASDEKTELISAIDSLFNLVEHVSTVRSLISCAHPGDADDKDASDLSSYKPTPAPIDPTILHLLPQYPAPRTNTSAQQPSRPIPNPPDLSLGLAKRQEKKDLVELEQFLLHLGTFTVYHNQLCQFEGPCWRKLDGRQSAVSIRHLLERHHLTNHLTRREYQELYNLLIINPSIQQYQEFSRPPHLLNLLDGTLNLMTMNLQPHDPQDGFFHHLDMDYEELLSPAYGTVFEQYVQQISNGNAAVRRQLLELVALVITGVEIKHFYVLLGPSNTGKTQFGRFLEELVGRDHVASIAGVHDFANRFTTSALAGKLLGTCLDLPDTPLPTIAIGTIKQFVGDDPIKVEQKYKDSRTIYQKPLLLFAGNHPIRISNITQEQALFNRMVVIPFQNPVAPAQMRQQLYKSLLEEAPYIIAQAIKAYRDLAARNFMVTTTRIPEEYEPQEASENHQAVQQFIKDCCCFDPEASIATEELYAAYKLYAAELHLNFLNKTVFSRALSNVLSQYDTICPVKRVAESSKRGYVGLTLQPYKEYNDHAIYSILHH